MCRKRGVEEYIRNEGSAAASQSAVYAALRHERPLQASARTDSKDSITYI
jgi:hypothetical protein